MRTKSLLTLILFLTAAIAFIIYLLASKNLRYLIKPIFLPILLVILTIPAFIINSWVLKWRRNHGGRDILEEERYETEGGMIKLTPNEKD